MSWQANASFPVCSNSLSQALLLHEAYADALDQWYVWLESGRNPANAEQFVLWSLIDLTITRRKPGGAWEFIDKRIVPTADELENVLDETKFSGFRDAVTRRRAAVEAAAKNLVTVLESVELRTQLAALPEVARWENVARLTEQLSDSHVGFLYLRKAVTSDVSPLPVIHPQLLLASALTWKSATADARRAARAYVYLVMKVTPALLADKSFGTFSDTALQLVAQFFPSQVVNALTAEEAVNDARDWFKAALASSGPDKPWWAEDAEIVTNVGMLVDLVNVGFAVHHYVSHPDDPAALAAMLRASSSLVGSVSGVAKATYGEAHFLVLSRSAAAVLSTVNAVYDIVMAAKTLYSSLETVRAGDYSVAIGQAMQGVGLAASAGISVFVAGVEAGWFAGTVAVGAGEVITVAALVPGLQIIAVAALLVVLVGSVVATYTVDSPFEQWLQNSWFGNKWDNVTGNEGPDSPVFRARRPDGSADLARQTSQWLSFFYPLTLTTETVTQGDASVVTLTCAPTLAEAVSQIAIWLIGDGKGYPRQLVSGVSWNDTAPIPLVYNLGPLDWSKGKDQHFSVTDRWIEVEMTLTARYGQNVLSNLIDESIDIDVPLTVLGRVKVT